MQPRPGDEVQPPSASGDPGAGHAADGAVAGNSVSVAMWTLVSRLVGFARVVTIAAVLGPTFFGNIFQATNLVPTLTYEFLTGALFTTLLVPPLVRYVDRTDRPAVERLAGGFLGVALLAFALVTVVAVIAGPLILRLLSLGVTAPSVAEAQRRLGWALLAMFMPQVLLYGVAATGAAVMNAHGRFALAAAAPAFESLGVIVTLAASGVVFGTGPQLGEVTTPQLLLLGLGTTGAVALHAVVQLWGARRVGVRLVPRAGWRDPEVREILGRAIPSLGYAGLNSLRVFAVLVVANRVPGGVVAFQLALNFFHLPVAVCARPVAVALLPSLSRLQQEGSAARFRDELTRGTALSMFLLVPAAVAYAVLALPLARAASFGEMATAAGVTMVAASLATLAAGVVGEGAFVMTTHASYARRDARAPLRAMATRTLVTLSGVVVAFVLVEGIGVLVTLGLAITVGNLASASHLARRLGAQLPTSQERLAPALLRAGGASAAMAAPALLVATSLADLLGGPWRHAVAMIAAAIVGLVVYLSAQRVMRSPELASLRGGLGWLRSGTPA